MKKNIVLFFKFDLVKKTKNKHTKKNKTKQNKQ